MESKNKYVIPRCFSNSVLVLILLLFCSCDRKQKDIFSEVHLVLEFPEGKNAVIVSPYDDQDRCFFRNLNTLQNYPLPDFVNGHADMSVLKGLYIFGFDAKADMGDGTVRIVRCNGFREPSSAVAFMDECDTVKLKLVYLR